MASITEPEPPRLDHQLLQPHAVWRRARHETPVLEAPDPVVPGRRTFMVFRHADGEAVIRDAETFSSAIHHEMIGPVMGETLVGMDGDEHRHYRELVAKAFRPSALAKWEDELIAPAIGRVLDDIAPLGRADLVRDVTARYPVQVIARIVGVPVEDYDRFQRWADDITGVAVRPNEARASSREMWDYLLPVVEDRRAHPRDDLVSDLATAEVDGERLSNDRIISFLRLLLPAGAETTFRALGNCLVALLTRPDALARVAADRSLIVPAVEETLRWETSVTILTRVATRDTEVAGVAIPAGAAVMVMTASANHDEARCDDPDGWNLDRPSQIHLYFGTGRHQCLGMHLARLEMRVGLNAILDRLANLRLDPDAAVPTIEGFAFRSPDAIPVVFTPS